MLALVSLLGSVLVTPSAAVRGVADESKYVGNEFICDENYAISMDLVNDHALLCLY